MRTYCLQGTPTERVSNADQVALGEPEGPSFLRIAVRKSNQVRWEIRRGHSRGQVVQ